MVQAIILKAPKHPPHPQAQAKGQGVAQEGAVPLDVLNLSLPVSWQSTGDTLGKHRSVNNWAVPKAALVPRPI